MTKPLAQELQRRPAGQLTPPVLRWIVSDLVTGDIVDDLTTLQPTYPLRRSIGKYDVADATLWLSGAHPSWERATLPGSVAMHCYAKDDPAKLPLWSGIVIKRGRGGGTGKVELSLATGEYYLDRRLCGTYTTTGRDQCEIVSDLVDDFANSSTTDYECVVDGEGSTLMPIVGINITVDWTASATTRDRNWFMRDEVSVYDRMQDLSGVQGGPEWAMEWRWNDDGDKLLPYLVVADRLGTAATTGLKPPAYTMPGCLVAAKYTEDYSDGKGANRIIDYSSGDGKRPVLSKPHISTVTDRPTWDGWRQPSTAISTQSVLDDHAAKDLEGTAFGANGLTLSASLSHRSTPRFGQRVHVGDDVYYEVDMPEFPGGIKGTARAEAFELNEGTISPIVTLNGPPTRIRAPRTNRVAVDGGTGLPPRTVFDASIPGRIIDSGRS